MFNAQMQYTKPFKWEQLHNLTLFCLADLSTSPAVDSSSKGLSSPLVSHQPRLPFNGYNLSCALALGTVWLSAYLEKTVFETTFPRHTLVFKHVANGLHQMNSSGSKITLVQSCGEIKQ